MGRYLDAIKKSANTEEGHHQNLQNPANDSFEGFVGSPPANFEKSFPGVSGGDSMSLLSAPIQKRETRKAATAISAIPATQPNERAATVARIATVAVANPTDAKTADAVTSWGWMLHFADREPLEVYCNPDATHAGILERYPDALAAEPIQERTRRTPTEAEAAELRALVQSIGEAEQWTADEIEWATAGALADPDGALICFRDIARGFNASIENSGRTVNAVPKTGINQEARND